MRRSIYRLIEPIILESLYGDPEKWVSDGYRLTNRDLDAKIWIANERYGLHVEISGLQIIGQKDFSFPGPWSWRGRLHAAVQNIKHQAEVVHAETWIDRQLGMKP